MRRTPAILLLGILVVALAARFSSGFSDATFTSSSATAGTVRVSFVISLLLPWSSLSQLLVNVPFGPRRPRSPPSEKLALIGGISSPPFAP